MMLRRGRARRRGLRPVRHARARGDRGVRRRSDGGAHAGVPGQEDRAARDEARRRCTSSPRPPSSSSAPAVALSIALGRRVDLQPGPHGLSEVLYAFTSAGQQQRQRVRRADRRTRPSTTPRSGSRCCSAASCRSCSCWAWPGRWPQEARPGNRRAPSRPTAAVRRRARRRVGSSSTALTYFPALALGPLAEGLTPMTTQIAPEAPVGRAPCRAGRYRVDAGTAVLASSTRGLMWRNPVMFVVEVGAALTTVLARRATRRLFAGSIAVWLWLTVLFANLAEAVAEGRGKAQAASLRAHAHRDDGPTAAPPTAARSRCPAPSSSAGDLVVVEAGEVIPGDGDIIEGIASVDESAITGESAPGHPRVRRRPLRRHRRHQGALGPDRRADHAEAGRDLPRPDDRAGRGRRAAEDAERDRAEHPARQPHDHLPAGDRDAAAVRHLLAAPSSP